jgi:hypothetical protein
MHTMDHSFQINSPSRIPDAVRGRGRGRAPRREPHGKPSFRRPTCSDTFGVTLGQDLDGGARRPLAEEQATIGTSEHTRRDGERSPSAHDDEADASPQHHDYGPSPAPPPPVSAVGRDSRPQVRLRETPPAPRPARGIERAVAFAAAILLDAASQTLEWMGLTRLRRLPGALACFGALFYFLGLPKGWTDAPFGGRVFELADWGPHTALRAFLVQLAATFAMRLVLALPRMRHAHGEVPSQTRRRLIERADELLASPIRDAHELQFWIEQHDAWLHQARVDLAESHSQDVADRLRSVATDKPVQFRHAFNPVHDGWLNLLARRIEYLRGLTDKDR